MVYEKILRNKEMV